MTIVVTEEIIERYKMENLPIEHIGTVMMIFTGLYEDNLQILDAIDDKNKEKRILSIYQHLNRKKFLEPSTNTMYVLTEKGLDFIKWARQQTGIKDGFTITLPNITSKEEVKDNSLPWISEWLQIFPKEKINGRYLRTNETECRDRMNTFIAKHGYAQDIIMQATKAYINNQEHSPEGHLYTRNSSYFISKGRIKNEVISDLATWCKIIEDGGVMDKEYIERDMV